jgi:hypothetical protein
VRTYDLFSQASTPVLTLLLVVSGRSAWRGVTGIDLVQNRDRVVSKNDLIASVCGGLRLRPRGLFSALYTGITANAQFIGHNYEEALRLAHEAVRQRGDFVGTHRVLAVAAGMAGQNRGRCEFGSVPPGGLEPAN